MNGEPAREDLLAVCTFARRFDDPGFVAGKWASLEPREDGMRMLECWVPSEAVARWQAGLYERNIVLPFDWMEPRWARRMGRYHEDPSLLDSAQLITIRRVLTTLVRAERFCDGTLGVAFERGVPQAAMRRMVDLIDAIRPTTTAAATRPS